MWPCRADWVFSLARLCADTGRPGLSLAELGERFIAESPWFYETAADWSRSPSNRRLTQSSHFPRLSGNEVYFELTLAHFSSVDALGGPSSSSSSPVSRVKWLP